VWIVVVTVKRPNDTCAAWGPFETTADAYRFLATLREDTKPVVAAYYPVPSIIEPSPSTPPFRR
jgi:hypothetical protein